MKAVSFLLIVFILTACSSSPVPKGILPPTQMQEVVFDLIKADEFINNFAVKDTNINIRTKRISLYEQVFNIHKTNKQDFYKSYRYYQQHPDKNKILFDTLHSVANRKKIEESKPKFAKPIDLTKPLREGVRMQE
jgi:hypothetical protein